MRSACSPPEAGKHHGMGQDLDGGGGVRDDWREQGFTGRTAALSERDALTGYHSSLLANHSHLLVRTGRLPLRRALIRPPYSALRNFRTPDMTK